MKATELRGKDITELKSLLSTARREQFKLRLVKSGGEMTNFKKIKEVRRDIARICTLLTEKQTLDTKEGKQ